MTLAHSVLLALLTAGAAPSVIFEESFKVSLSPGWSWVREDKDAWKLGDGTIQIRAAPGNIWEGENNARNLLLREPPERGKKFTAEVTVAHTPITFGEQAGLLWYRDDDNYVKLVKEFYEGKTWVVVAVETGGKANYREADCRAEWVTFRLTVAGDRVTAAFRPVGGTDWKSMGQFTFDPKTDARIGLTAHHAPKGSDRVAHFRDFRITAAP
jgi:regulation of enolase protein 1 (concanavalin A-like superfamily)